jgi:predicted O-methyltransferase YrrM
MPEYNDYITFLKNNNLFDIVRYRSMNDLGCEYITSLLIRKKFNNILEIGRSKGYTFGLFKFFSPDSMVISIDIVHTEESELLANMMQRPYNLIQGTSDNIKEIDIKYDLVLIDGDHSYDGCKKDWINIQDYLNENAIVIFDDLDHGGGCGQVFYELDKDKEVYEVDGVPILGVVYI